MLDVCEFLFCIKFNEFDNVCKKKKEDCFCFFIIVNVYLLKKFFQVYLLILKLVKFICVLCRINL